MRRGLVSLSGVVFFVTLLASRILSKSAPKSTASGVKLLQVYESKHGLMIASATLGLIATAVGVVFFGVLRDHLRSDAQSRGLAATGFGGALIFLCGPLVVAGATLGLTDHTDKLAPATARTLNLIRWDMQSALLSAGAAVMLCTFGLAIIRSSLLPRWLGWLAFPLAIVSLIPRISPVSAVLVALWTLSSSIATGMRVRAVGGATMSSHESVPPVATG